MTMTTTPITGVEPIGRREASKLAEAAYARFADVVDTLGPGDWARPTDCVGWTVRDLVGHMVGAMRSAASVRELGRQQREIARRRRRDGGDPTDIMTALQIELTSTLIDSDLAAECRALVPEATAGRGRIPAPVRRLVSFRVEVGGTRERWKLGYLLDVVLTRDAWLHRIDLCRAIGAAPVLTAEDDGRIIADAAAEWARRHRQPFHLVLTGPAGGAYASRPDEASEPIEIDAVEFCRTVSGRSPGTGLLAVDVPF